VKNLNFKQKFVRVSRGGKKREKIKVDIKKFKKYIRVDKKSKI